MLVRLSKFMFRLLLILAPHLYVGLFTWDAEEVMSKDIIYCPKCARELCRVAEKQTISFNTGCKCGLYYRINPVYRTATPIDKPNKVTSSGATFY